MDIVAEKVYKVGDNYIRIRVAEDGSSEEFPITESEYLEAVQKQPETEIRGEEDKFSSPIGFREDGREFTEEEIENVRKWLYPK
jgi:hypothetical protein